VFFDDILMYSSTLEQHVNQLPQVLQLLQQDKWQVKLSKFSFAQRKIDYLSHVISGDGVR
jgi:primary-amine oxidase